uniref:Uncharacterized protein n=1 Tax=Salmonella sp. TaxID=599 RepID=A0A482ETD0_SALSP|nr:hypothetical protein NNIBIDOC_00037 [Salmonella sp.]
MSVSHYFSMIAKLCTILKGLSGVLLISHSPATWKHIRRINVVMVNMSVAEIDAATALMIVVVMAHGCTGMVRVLPVPVDYQAKAETARQKLLNDANNVIKDWRTELTLGIISDETKSL